MFHSNYNKDPSPFLLPSLLCSALLGLLIKGVVILLMLDCWAELPWTIGGLADGLIAVIGGLSLTQEQGLKGPILLSCFLSNARAQFIFVARLGGRCISTSRRIPSVSPTVNKSTCWSILTVVARTNKFWNSHWQYSMVPTCFNQFP